MKKTRPRRYPVAGFRRGGSSILFELIEFLCLHDDIPCIDLVGRQDRAGRYVDELSNRTLRQAFEKNTFVGVFRDFPEKLHEQAAFFEFRPIVIVRDPIDCALSWYFARHLHKPRDNDDRRTWNQEQYSLGEFIRHHDDFYIYAQPLIDNLKQYDCLYIKYEDLVASPMGAIYEIMQHTGVVFSREAIDLYCVKANFLRLTADAGSHNRSGLSGSLFDQCSIEEIGILYDRYSKIIRKFGYGANYGVNNSRQLPWDRLEIDSMKRVCTKLLKENHNHLLSLQNLTEEVQALRSYIVSVRPRRDA